MQKWLIILISTILGFNDNIKCFGEYRTKNEYNDNELKLISAKIINNKKKETIFSCDNDIYILLKLNLRKKIKNLLGYITIQNTEGHTIIESDSNDSKLNYLDKLNYGDNIIKLTIPKRTLGHGEYYLYINFSGIRGSTYENIESPGKILRFVINDYNTERGNSRRGYFSTLLNWKIND